MSTSRVDAIGGPPVENVDVAKLRRIREALPVFQHGAYLNTGSSGPLPRVTSEAMREDERGELEWGRTARPERERSTRQHTQRVRQGFAWLLNADPDEIALMRSTTEGMNAVLWGIDWQPGDRVLTTSLEHEAVLVPLSRLERRHQLEIERVDIGVGQPSQVLDAFEQALEYPARLIAISHVAYSTGAVLPLAELTELAHRTGALVAVDAAQAAGALPVDMAASGVDFYALPGQKWLCGPEGMGALYVAERHWDELHATYGGIESIENAGADPADFVPRAGARRFELGHNYPPLYAGMSTSLSWLDEIGWGWIHARIVHLSAYAAARLSELPDVSAVLPVGQARGLVSVQLDRVDPEPMAEQLIAQGIIVRWVRQPRALRVSTGFYNTEQEIDNLRDALGDVLRQVRP